jgi:hypothetical protein
MTIMGTENEASALMCWRICGTAEWLEHEELMRKQQRWAQEKGYGVDGVWSPRDV